jgi:hypothetical protein
MNPGASKTARLLPARAKNQHLKQEGNPKKQQTYPQTTSYTATTEGGSILDENPGSILDGKQHTTVEKRKSAGIKTVMLKDAGRVEVLSGVAL